MKLRQELHRVISERYHAHLRSGGSIMGFHEHLNLLGIKTEPKPLDTMLYATGQHERIKKEKEATPEGYVRIEMHGLGDMLVPDETATRAEVLGFLP